MKDTKINPKNFLSIKELTQKENLKLKGGKEKPINLQVQTGKIRP